jgi:hypothetical protein
MDMACPVAVITEPDELLVAAVLELADAEVM